MTTATTIILLALVVQLERLIRNTARTERHLKRRA